MRPAWCGHSLATVCDSATTVCAKTFVTYASSKYFSYQPHTLFVTFASSSLHSARFNLPELDRKAVTRLSVAPCQKRVCGPGGVTPHVLDPQRIQPPHLPSVTTEYKIGSRVRMNALQNKNF